MPENLLLTLWELLKAVSSFQFQDVAKYKENARFAKKTLFPIKFIKLQDGI